MQEGEIRHGAQSWDRMSPGASDLQKRLELGWKLDVSDGQVFTQCLTGGQQDTQKIGPPSFLCSPSAGISESLRQI